MPLARSLVSVKVRSGFDDPSRFRENLLAAAEGGADFVTVHPRTRRQGYSGAADWSLIAVAKATLKVPVVRVARQFPSCYPLGEAQWKSCPADRRRPALPAHLAARRSATATSRRRLGRASSSQRRAATA